MKLHRALLPVAPSTWTGTHGEEVVMVEVFGLSEDVALGKVKCSGFLPRRIVRIRQDAPMATASTLWEVNIFGLRLPSGSVGVEFGQSSRRIALHELFAGLDFQAPYEGGNVPAPNRVQQMDRVKISAPFRVSDGIESVSTAQTAAVLAIESRYSKESNRWWQVKMVKF